MTLLLIKAYYCVKLLKKGMNTINLLFCSKLIIGTFVYQILGYEILR